MINTSWGLILNVKKLNELAIPPTKANSTDAGYDLYSVEDLNIAPHQRALVHTGISMAIPNDYVGLVWPRSGLAVKHGIDVLAGVVDSGYRGEVCVVLQNHGDKIYQVRRGDRVAQMLFQKVSSFNVYVVEDLETSDRGISGFGSTGV
jgi:dUTP pyrophosphatase